MVLDLGLEEERNALKSRVVHEPIERVDADLSLADVGVPIDAQTGIPAHDPETLETSVPNLFIAGVVVAGFDANKVFIENGRYHGDKIVARILRRSAPAEPKLSAELDT